MSISYSEHSSITTPLADLVADVGKMAETAFTTKDREDLRFLNHLLRSALGFAESISAEQDEVDKSADSHDDGPQ